ncbi:MAG TPA: IS21 family transposase, partial [Gammaproteobacteria bacterium]|nr:IS21 family transposase [Gammaproteobacteria bacterium]
MKISVGAVSLYLKKAKLAKLSWPLPDDMNDQAIEAILFPNQANSAAAKYVIPDYAAMHKALKHKGVTKQLLWEEC